MFGLDKSVYKCHDDVISELNFSRKEKKEVSDIVEIENSINHNICDLKTFDEDVLKCFNNSDGNINNMNKTELDVFLKSFFRCRRPIKNIIEDKKKLKRVLVDFLYLVKKDIELLEKTDKLQVDVISKIKEKIE
jgi:hypothetical protein